MTRIGIRGLSHGFRQNSNNSVSIKERLPARRGGGWRLRPDARKDGRVMKTLKGARSLESISHAARASADPGLHFNTTMNDGTPAGCSPDPRASNPCSEYISSTTRLAICLAQPIAVQGCRDQADQYRRLRACRPSLDGRSRSLGDDGAVPVPRDRRLSDEYRTLGPAMRISAAC